jgi:hypothetical protein
MTATAWHAVTSPWGLLYLGAYAVLVVLILCANHAAHRKPSPPWTDMTLSQPPVPTQADVDATWLDPWPVGDDDETRLRFDQIVSAEEWAS